jgi:ectoine hydroxylase-related dioxygenase (phytanoyl-CoA dioxygenase family)
MTSYRFARDGYVIVRGLICRAVLADVCREVRRIHAVDHEPTCSRPNNTLIPLRWNHAIVTTLLEDSSLVEYVAALTSGADPRWISGYVSSKKPDSGPLPWHQDWWCWEHPISLAPGPAQVALVVYLTETDEDRGALRLQPGSHRTSTPLHAALAETDPAATAALPADHALMADAPGQVTARLSPGDGVLMDYRLLHGTHPNRATTRRDAVILNFTPTWGALPSEIRGHLISHPALPLAGEQPDIEHHHLLPDFAGTRTDLPLRLIPPSSFTIPDKPDRRQ